MHGNFLIATIAVMCFASFFIGYSLGWLQRDELTPTIEIEPDDFETRARWFQ